MINIGLNHSFDQGTFSELFIRNGFNMVTLDKHNLSIAIEDLDGIVLYALEDQEAIFEWIVEIRKLSSLYIWVCLPTEKVKIQRLLYLHLGVDGVFVEENLEEMFLVMKRALIRGETIGGSFKNESSITLIPEKSSVKIGMNEVSLTRLEYHFLSVLLKNPSGLTSYETLKEEIWGDISGAVSHAQLATLVAHLRNKLKMYSDQLMIKTIRTKGYTIVM